MLGSRSLDNILRKARQKLATGDFDQAHRLVAKGLERFADAEALRDLELTIRRAQARAGIQSLKTKIARDHDHRAYEELIDLYLELGLHAEARTEALDYARAHPDRDTPHLTLGEMSLQAFFEDLLARDAHNAHQRLVRAARLNHDAIKPRLLLAELYFCLGADRQLGIVADSLEEIARDDPVIEPLIAKIRDVAQPSTSASSLDGLFERVEVNGCLVREPTEWPLTQRRKSVARVDESRARSCRAHELEGGQASTRSTATAQNLNSGILPSGSSTSVVSTLAAASR